MKEKIKAAGLHFLLSLVLISLVFCLIYFVWFPRPFYELSGGRSLIELIFAVDLVLGPLLTFVVFNKKKTIRHNAMDISIVACIQLAALAYGVHTVYQARPIYVVFEYYRFNVVHANDIDPATLSQASDKALQQLPMWGPKLLALARPAGGDAQFDSVTLAMNGVPQAAQPSLWIPYKAAAVQILQESKPVKNLLQRLPQQAARIEQLLSQSGIPLDRAIYLPAIIKKEFWTVVLDKDQLDKPYYLNVDSFE